MPGPDEAVGELPPPAEFVLAEDDALLACPWHGWEYDLATGQSFLGPGEPPVAPTRCRSNRRNPRASGAAGRVPGPYVAETFPVHVEDAYVVVETTPVGGGAGPALPEVRDDEHAGTDRRTCHPARHTIVDTDIHPHALARDIVPRLGGAPQAVGDVRQPRARPARDLPAGAQLRVPARLLARGRLPGQRPADVARPAARRVRDRPRGPHPAAGPQLGRGAAAITPPRSAGP